MRRLKAVESEDARAASGEVIGGRASHRAKTNDDDVVFVLHLRQSDAKESAWVIEKVRVAPKRRAGVGCDIGDGQPRICPGQIIGSLNFVSYIGRAGEVERVRCDWLHLNNRIGLKKFVAGADEGAV